MVKLNKKIRRYLALVLCLSILLVPVEGYAAKNNQSTTQRVRTTTTAAGWVSSGGRWWYRNADGSYPKSTWKLIYGSWYYFESDGWMATGWKKLGGEWYYLTSSGAMASGWVKLYGKYYFMNGSGVMQHDTWVDNGAYYVNSDGVWVEGKTSQNRAESSRTDSTAGWVSGGGRWWYREPFSLRRVPLPFPASPPSGCHSGQPGGGRYSRCGGNKTSGSAYCRLTRLFLR